MLCTMKEMLDDAMRRGYAVGYFNTVNLEMITSCIQAAEECSSPVIIGTAEALLPYAGLETIAPLLLESARRSKVPVAVHMDHTYRPELLLQALRAGFGSVMFDGTRLPDHGDNLRESARLAAVAHAMGVGIECELGSVGGLSDTSGKEDPVVYTDPDDAREFVQQTGADFLAVSIGTQHGVYKAEPRLDIPRLEQIRAAVSVPLVLHGGSGLSDLDFRRTVHGGISKINVYTDVIAAAKQATLQAAGSDYPDVCAAARKAMQAAVRAKLELFGSCGMA